jgi:GrpB-like predicted nucleotidyltransferase (UPF0157 family)
MYLSAYKREWPDEYRNEAQAILAIYQGSIQLHHIGSTAVAGLYSKDCIDILGVVDDITEVKHNLSCLENLGFKYKGGYGVEGREYFSRDARKVHFHIFQVGNINIKKHLGFVQVMKSRPDLIAQLNSLKVALAQKHPLDKDAYQKEKKFFYDDIHRML